MIGRILICPCTSPQTDTASCSECVRVCGGVSVEGDRCVSIWDKWTELRVGGGQCEVASHPRSFSLSA